jgi:dolichol-phosphate mannosyltransferase
MLSTRPSRIAAVVPCYRVRQHIKSVIESMPSQVTKIYIVDDCCPEESGLFVQNNVEDARICIIRNERNAGVGGAVKNGFKRALEDGMDIVVKIDGDGQMDPFLLPLFCSPIQVGAADYTKGNRFYDLTCIRQMPPIRIVGNAILSFLTKLSTGYWSLFDVNNGFVAISSSVLRHINFDEVSDSYFFETDMLFQLGLLRAKVVDIPMDARYADEVSSLKISRVCGEFALKHAKNLFKRILYNYFLRDFSVASLQLVLGLILLVIGLIAGSLVWAHTIHTLIPTPLGTVMLIATALFSGLLFLLSFINYDMSNSPQTAIQGYLPNLKRYGSRSD